MHKGKAYNTGQAILEALSAGVQGISSGLAQERQSRQQERSNRLQDFMAVLEFENAQRAETTRNLSNQKIQQDISRNNERLKRISVFEGNEELVQQFSGSFEVYELFLAEQAKQQAATAGLQNRFEIAQGLGTAGDLTRFGTGLGFAAPSTGTQPDRDRSRFISDFNPGTPQNVIDDATRAFDQGLTPAKMASNARTEFGKAVNRNVVKTGIIAQPPSPEERAAAAVESGYSPQFRTTEQAAIIDAYQAFEGEELDKALGQIKDHFANLRVETIKFFGGASAGK